MISFVLFHDFIDRVYVFARSMISFVGVQRLGGADRSGRHRV